MSEIKKIKYFTDPNRKFGWEGNIDTYEGSTEFVTVKDFKLDMNLPKIVFNDEVGDYFVDGGTRYYLKDFKDEVWYIPSQVVEL